jgi:hypothetical protein
MIESAVRITEGRLSLDRSQCRTEDPQNETNDQKIGNTRKVTAYFDSSYLRKDGVF